MDLLDEHRAQILGLNDLVARLQMRIEGLATNEAVLRDGSRIDHTADNSTLVAALEAELEACRAKRLEHLKSLADLEATEHIKRQSAGTDTNGATGKV